MIAFGAGNLIQYYKMNKKSIVIDLYQAALRRSVFTIGYSMLGEKILKITPPSIQKFDLEDTGKLVAIVAASEMAREYLVKQKSLPEHINPICAPLPDTFFPCCSETVCSRLMKLSDFQYNYIGHHLK